MIGPVTLLEGADLPRRRSFGPLATLEASGVRIATVSGAPGYFVTDSGEVWSTRDFHGRTRAVPHRLRPSADQDGYLSVSLCLRGKRRARKVAALVLEAFVGPAPAGTESCHHPDPSPTNNRLDNLRWATHQGNIDDKVALGRQARGVGHGSAKLTEDEVREVRITAGTLQEIADRYGVSTFCVWAIRTGKTWKHLR